VFPQVVQTFGTQFPAGDPVKWAAEVAEMVHIRPFTILSPQPQTGIVVSPSEPAPALGTGPLNLALRPTLPSVSTRAATNYPYQPSSYRPPYSQVPAGAFNEREYWDEWDRRNEEVWAKTQENLVFAKEGGCVEPHPAPFNSAYGDPGKNVIIDNSKETTKVFRNRKGGCGGRRKPTAAEPITFRSRGLTLAELEDQCAPSGLPEDYREFDSETYKKLDAWGFKLVDATADGVPIFSKLFFGGVIVRFEYSKVLEISKVCRSSFVKLSGVNEEGVPLYAYPVEIRAHGTSVTEDMTKEQVEEADRKAGLESVTGSTLSDTEVGFCLDDPPEGVQAAAPPAEGVKGV